MGEKYLDGETKSFDDSADVEPSKRAVPKKKVRGFRGVQNEFFLMYNKVSRITQKMKELSGSLPQEGEPIDVKFDISELDIELNNHSTLGNRNFIFIRYTVDSFDDRWDLLDSPDRYSYTCVYNDDPDKAELFPNKVKIGERTGDYRR